MCILHELTISKVCGRWVPLLVHTSGSEHWSNEEAASSVDQAAPL